MHLSLFARATTALLGAVAAGCQSKLETRLRENAALVASLDPATQATLRDGLIDLGFTRQLVALAVGPPDRVQSGESAHGPMETWSYRNFVYSATAAAKLGMNNPGTRYQGGRLVSPNAPGGPSLASTKPTGPQPGVSDMADAAVGTLHVDFLDGKVFSLRLDR